jgi:hypothetical protein
MGKVKEKKHILGDDGTKEKKPSSLMFADCWENCNGIQL